MRLDPNPVLGGESGVAHVPGKAARPIATLLHFGTIGVVDDVFKVDALAGRRTHRKNLVGPDPKMPIPQKTVVRRSQTQATTGLIQHDKVVAGTLHFGERDPHGVHYPGMSVPDTFGGTMPAMVRPTHTLENAAPQMPARQAWQSLIPVPLTRNVLRLTAPNPGIMTGPGTNSYLVGSATTGFTVIDPGPADADHQQRLWEAAVHPDGSGGNILRIVCTHSHPDHAPGAAPLQALCAVRPPILGLPSAPTARPGSTFTPDRTLEEGERLTHHTPRWLADSNPSIESSTLQVIYTPGHAANHICLLLQEDGLLFSGDHILSGSTTVIDPPDGNMADYLNALDTLHSACTRHAVQHILPAHGHVIDDALGAIAHLKAHRLQREAKIAAILQAHPDGDLDQWLPLAYDDVDPRVWPVARRSLLAHVERIRSLGAAGSAP